MRISFGNRSYLRENVGARFGKMFRSRCGQICRNKFSHLRSLPTHNTFLRSWRQHYPQRDRKVFICLPNEIRINMISNDEFEKLETRVEYVENLLNMPKK